MLALVEMSLEGFDSIAVLPGRGGYRNGRVLSDLWVRTVTIGQPTIGMLKNQVPHRECKGRNPLLKNVLSPFQV